MRSTCLNWYTMPHSKLLSISSVSISFSVLLLTLLLHWEIKSPRMMRTCTTFAIFVILSVSSLIRILKVDSRGTFRRIIISGSMCSILFILKLKTLLIILVLSLMFKKSLKRRNTVGYQDKKPCVSKIWMKMMSKTKQILSFVNKWKLGTSALAIALRQWMRSGKKLRKKRSKKTQIRRNE